MNIDTKPLVPRTTMKTKSIRKKSKVSPPKIVPLKPLLSPYPQPTIHHASPMPQNNQNNNTRYLHENKQIPSFLSGIEGRRSAHKMAEQRRRDVLKQSFDSLRSEITDVMVTDCINESCSQESIREEKEKEVQNMSKVLLLQYSYEYIVRLKRDAHQKDQKLEKMQLEIKKLRSKVAS
jgi:valyl-tRNA synthetase